MAEANNNTSHKCCAAALCNNRSDNQKDLIFHNFPLDQSQRKIWEVRIKRGDEKFASNRSLFCCSEHFTATDYRPSLTGRRRDLVKNAIPSVFPWSVDEHKDNERSKRAKDREGKKLQQSVAKYAKTVNRSCQLLSATENTPDLEKK